ncbi:hypothetical protein DNK57_06900 [Methanothermobacter thermautotrophicus]|uniref:4-vinyl reductase 4VR domain-containing protein n=1 Tax=Methanothermobacter thermautotrophicus TaxID=145262 RepID=A0A842YPH6_METTF|nr:V4R domain-containing protein [Methanothermobacter thermautotrophicus]MBE2900520.1 hypothetical protein [Methanothermobacter thermautotrophicus]
MESIGALIEEYRRITDHEIRAERDGLGPRRPVKDNIEFKDLFSPERRFFSSSDDDACYVSSFRMGHFNIPDIISGSAAGVSYIGGLNLGRTIIAEGMANDINSLADFMLEQKLGILDAVSEWEEDGYLRMDVRVYECIECSGLPNIGRPICFFEAGIIAGALSEILDCDADAYERRCWTNGYSCCQFDVKARI